MLLIQRAQRRLDLKSPLHLWLGALGWKDEFNSGGWRSLDPIDRARLGSESHEIERRGMIELQIDSQSLTFLRRSIIKDPSRDGSRLHVVFMVVICTDNP